MGCASQVPLTVNLYFLIQIYSNALYNVMLGIIKIQNHIYVKNVVLFLIQIVFIVMRKNVYFAQIDI